MDKVLIVTGGSRGIGAATARIASRRGYAVCVNFLKTKQLQRRSQIKLTLTVDMQLQLVLIFQRKKKCWNYLVLLMTG